MMIERALSSDAEKLATLHRSTRKAAMPWLPVLHAPDEVVWYFAHVVLPMEKVLIVRHGAEVMGFVAFDKGWLHHLYVAPERWGCGLGSELLNAAKTYSDYLQLWVFQKNTRARRFYSRHGFREREFTNGSNNEEKMPDIRMDWGTSGPGYDKS
jgi:GNAT superfamily N-acetyltransferase